MPVSWGLDGSAEPTTRWIGGVQALPGLPPALPGGADPAVERLRLLGVDALAEGEGIGGEPSWRSEIEVRSFSKSPSANSSRRSLVAAMATPVPTTKRDEWRLLAALSR